MSNSTLTDAERTVGEETTSLYTATLTDETGTVIPSADLSSLTLTLYNEATGAIINSRSAQDVLNTNGVTVHATSGLLSWTIAPADTPIVDTNLRPNATETHVAQFDFAWNSGAAAGRHFLRMVIEQALKVT